MSASKARRAPAPWMLLAACLFAACGEATGPATGATAPVVPDPGPPAPPAADSVAARPAIDGAEATPSGALPDGDHDLARLDGYGPLRFGMTLAEMRAAWGATLHGEPPDGGADACYYLNVVGEGATPWLAFMLEGGRFVRYDVSNDALLAPGGGRRGIAEAELQALYKGALQASPHHYVEGGKYLAFDTSGVAPSRLVFETDARGRVTEWRVGLSPQADYVEGCS